jgi:uncharacterized protein
VRIVLDANVIVSALIWSGAPYSLLQAAIERDVTLCTSPALITELTEVLQRSHLTPKLEGPAAQLSRPWLFMPR